MDGNDDGTYQGTKTTGFQSPAQDHIEHVVDLARVLDLSKPGIYPVRVKGQELRHRGIHDGDILIANTAASPGRLQHRCRWTAKAEYLSPRYATRLEEIVGVNA